MKFPNLRCYTDSIGIMEPGVQAFQLAARAGVGRIADLCFVVEQAEYPYIELAQLLAIRDGKRYKREYYGRAARELIGLLESCEPRARGTFEGKTLTLTLAPNYPSASN